MFNFTAVFAVFFIFVTVIPIDGPGKETQPVTQEPTRAWSVTDGRTTGWMLGFTEMRRLHVDSFFLLISKSHTLKLRTNCFPPFSNGASDEFTPSK